MKINYRVNSKVTIQLEPDSDVDAFKQLAHVEEVFGDSCCGKCKKDNLSYHLRVATKGNKRYEYPEIRCKDCYAKLTFGQMEGGTVFPVRFQREGGEYIKGEDGKNVPRGNWGWVLYNKATGKEE